METIRFDRVLSLKASPAELWPLVSNTNRLNRALGLPAMELDGAPGPDFVKKVSANVFGLPLTWDELPFEWIQPLYYNTLRLFSRGPIARFEGGMELEPQNGGCVVKVKAEFDVRSSVAAFLLRHVGGKKAIADTEELLRRFEASLSGSGEPYVPKRLRTAVAAGPFAQKAERLRRAPIPKALAEALLAHLERGYDDELNRMRPFELADRWGTPRLETLRAFFHGVRAGLMDLSWEVLCPNCSAPKETAGTLSDLKQEAHCASCDIVYGVNFDESVELRFTISPTVRAAKSHVFCVGSPAHSPFALVQLLVDPGKPRTVAVTLEAESYVLRDLGAKAAIRLRPSPLAPSDLTLDLARPAVDDEVGFKPGPVRLTLKPPISRALVRLEREGWRDRAAKASVVTTLQEFRDLFSSEVLAPGVEISVKNVALLFSDLKDSTAMYERIGDATAYAVVRDHFDYLFEIIKKREGAVVKTIGDAVMAVFTTAANAVAAAVEMQERIHELNRTLSPRPPVVIKLGVHQGPSIAINSNGVLDYFGTTINVAARVQNESKGGDIVVSQAVHDDIGAQEALAGHPIESDEFQIALKGLSEHFRLWRLKPAKKPA